MADKTRAQILGENLKRIREEKGVSRKQLADILGIVEDSIGGYETGKKLAPLDKIFTMAEFLNVSIVDLTGDTPFADVKKILQYRLNRAEGIAASAGFLATQLDEGGVMLIPQAKILENADGTFTSVVDHCYTFNDTTEFINFTEFVESQMWHYAEDKSTFTFKPTFKKLIEQKFKKRKR